MSARDDFPTLADFADHTLFQTESGMQIVRQAREALAEIDHHRQWKAEAIEVLKGWERVWEECGRPGPLGGVKSENVLQAIREAML